MGNEERSITDSKYERHYERAAIRCLWYKDRVLCKNRGRGRKENKSVKNGLGKTDLGYTMNSRPKCTQVGAIL